MTTTRGIMLVVVAAAAAVPSLAQAQTCVGLPYKTVFATGTRDETGMLTGSMGVGPIGRVTLTGNVALPKDPPNGSQSISYGGRGYLGGARGNWGACVLGGMQIGYSHLINAEGVRANAQITVHSIPLGLAYGRVVPLTRGVRLVAHAAPQAIFRFRDVMLYTRADTATVSNSEIEYGIALGAGLQVGPLIFRGTVFRSDIADWSWSVAAGVGR